MKNAATAWSVLLLVSFVQGCFAATRDLHSVKRILVLGDSLSEGLNIDHSKAYPALLANKLRSAGLDFIVTTASASGGTTAGGLQRLASHLKRNIDIFILELGVNDAFRGVPVERIRG